MDNATLFSIIDAADEHGLYRFSAHIRDEPSVLEKMSREEKIRSLVEMHFYDLPLLTLRLDNLKKHIVHVGACGPDTTVNAAGVWNVQLELARLMLLPAVEPKAELQQARKLFDTMLPFFASDPTRQVDVQIVNERDSHGTIQGRLTCRVRDPAARKMITTSDSEACTAQLRSLVAESPALQHFMKQTALALQKVGPWSWVCISEDQLYGHQRGPYSNHRYEQAHARVRERQRQG